MRERRLRGHRRTAGRPSPRRAGARRSRRTDGRTRRRAPRCRRRRRPARTRRRRRPARPVAASESPLPDASCTSTSKPTRRPASLPLTRARLPAASRRPSRSSTSKGTRRPAGARVRIGEHVEHGLGTCGGGGRGGPCPHGGTLAATASPVVGLPDDPAAAVRTTRGSSSRMTRRSSCEDDDCAARARLGLLTRCSDACARWTRSGPTCCSPPLSSSKGWSSSRCWCRTARRTARARSAVIVVLAGAVAIRRRWPVVSALVGMPLFIAFSALGADYGDHMVSPFFVMMFLLYSFGRNLEGRTLNAVVGVRPGLRADLAGHRRVRRRGDQLRALGRRDRLRADAARPRAPQPRHGSTARCARRRAGSSATARAAPRRRRARSARGSPASCTTSSRTR